MTQTATAISECRRVSFECELRSCARKAWTIAFALRAVLLGAGQLVHVRIPRRPPWVSRRSWRRRWIERAVLDASLFNVTRPAKTL